jgi:hypothetical protein
LTGGLELPGRQGPAEAEALEELAWLEDPHIQVCPFILNSDHWTASGQSIKDGHLSGQAAEAENKPFTTWPHRHIQANVQREDANCPYLDSPSLPDGEAVFSVTMEGLIAGM